METLADILLNVVGGIFFSIGVYILWFSRK